MSQVSVRERLKAHKKGLESLGLTVLGAAIAAVVGVLATNTFGGNGFPLPEPPEVLIDAEASLVNPVGDEGGAEEYVCLVNVSGRSVNLTGWKLYDAEGKVNELSQFSLKPDLNVRVHPGGRGRYENTAHDVYGNEDSRRWNNEGDTAILYDAEGEKLYSQFLSGREDGDVSGNCGPPLRPDGGEGEGTGGTAAPQQRAGSLVDRDCTDFPTQARAQAFFDEIGPEGDPHGLDANANGEACESLPP